MDQALAFALLAVGLAAFTASTRQFPLLARALIWLVGAGLLVGAGWTVLGDGAHFGVLRAAADALRERDLAQSALGMAVAGNWRAVSAALIPMFDVFLVLSALVGVVALIAFTPGERIERALRPTALFVGGAIAGALLALAIVAGGLGGQPQRQVYLAVLAPEDVIDGDTLAFGDMHIRLAGVDALEADQTCSGNPEIASCGALAKAHLQALVRDALVICTDPQASARTPRKLRTSFGRPIARCFARTADGANIDLAERLIADGWAVPFKEEQAVRADYTAAALAARTTLAGVWTGCTLAPNVWRTDQTMRNIFLGGGEPPKPDTIGACSN